jgi:multidrug efflux system membrane fusion protein
VDVTLRLAVQNDAVVAPARAVQVGRTNKYVYVIKPDNTVEVRPVTVRRISTDEVVVEQGLQKDERVVTDGQVRLTAGARVEIVPEAEKKTATPGAAS